MSQLLASHAGEHDARGGGAAGTSPAAAAAPPGSPATHTPPLPPFTTRDARATGQPMPDDAVGVALGGSTDEPWRVEGGRRSADLVAVVGSSSEEGASGASQGRATLPADTAGGEADAVSVCLVSTGHKPSRSGHVLVQELEGGAHAHNASLGHASHTLSLPRDLRVICDDAIAEVPESEMEVENAVVPPPAEEPGSEDSQLASAVETTSALLPRPLLRRVLQKCGPSGPAWVRYISEFVATVALALLAAVLQFFVTPPALSFLEQDLTLSYALVRPETIPNYLLFILSIGLPAVTIFIVHVVYGFKRKYVRRAVFVNALWCLLALAQALVIVFALTNLLKTGTGRPRPNFFSFCDYNGYRAAQAAQDLTEYMSATRFGLNGDLSKCRAPHDDIAESLRSFPSGHASISFTGMAFLSNFLRAVLRIPRGVYVSVPSLIAASPFVLSSFIAVSRVRDRWHNTDDIVIGACIGLVSGVAAWRHYSALRRRGTVAAATQHYRRSLSSITPGSGLIATKTSARGSLHNRSSFGFPPSERHGGLNHIHLHHIGHGAGGNGAGGHNGTEAAPSGGDAHHNAMARMLEKMGATLVASHTAGGAHANTASAASAVHHHTASEVCAAAAPPTAPTTSAA